MGQNGRVESRALNAVSGHDRAVLSHECLRLWSPAQQEEADESAF